MFYLRRNKYIKDMEAIHLPPLTKFNTTMKNLIKVILLAFSITGNINSQENTVRIMTYNIHHGAGIDKKIDIERIGKLFIANKADLIAIQEVDRNVERSNKIDIVKLLHQQIKYDTVFGKNIDFMGGDYGNAILSKYKIKSSLNHHYEMLRQGEQRGILQTVININNIEVVFINTHTGDKNTEEEKLCNVKEIYDIIKKYEGLPIIICGDFNDQPGSKMHEAMKDKFIDVWEMLNDDKGFTFPSTNSDRRIDYIYFSKESINKLKPVSIKVIQSEASDHLPLLAEFEIIK